MKSITIASPVMAAHLGGCRDSHKVRGRATSSMLTDYIGDTLMDAIMETDRTLAAEYGQEPYVQSDDAPWAVAFCDIAPCLRDELRREGITFDQLGRPSKATR